MELDDVGTEQTIVIPKLWRRTGEPVKVIMGIKAPHGKCFLYESQNVDGQCKAIKAFIEGHRNE